MKNTKINETVSAGATGSSSIAVSLAGSGNGGDTTFSAFLKRMNKSLANKNSGNFKLVTPFPIKKLTESHELQDVLSRLRGVEGKYANNSPRDNTTFAVEDDDGNIMKITVKKDAAAEFEVALAHELSDRESSVLGGPREKISMAELLFNLKDRFSIIDVEFPTIPVDAIYNADKATEAPAGMDAPVADDNVQEPGQEGMDDSMGGGIDTGLDGPTGNAMDSSLGDDDLGPVGGNDGPLNLDDVNDVEDNSTTGSGLLSNNSGTGTDTPAIAGPEGDDDMVSDFDDTATDNSSESILDKVIDLLKANVSAQEAQAQAEIEKARALQAEYSARAVDATLKQETELAGMEAKMKQQKEEAKDARRLADIAKFRVEQGSKLTEADAMETPAMIRRMLSQLNMRWRVLPEDTPDVAEYKRAKARAERMELNARLRSAQTSMNFAKKTNSTNTDPNLRNAQQNQQNQQAGMQGSPNGQIGATGPQGPM